MTSLSKCLKKMGLSEHEAAILRGAAKGYREDDGMEAHAAAVQAVNDYIEELQAERASIIEQAKAAGGRVPVDPVAEQPVQELANEPMPIAAAPRSADFARWSRGAPYVPAEGALEYDFKTGQSFVAQSYHGTNAEEDFDAFDLDKGGVMTAAESAALGIFSTSEPVVAGNYASNVGMGRYLGLVLGSHVKEYGDNPEYRKLASEASEARTAAGKAWHDERTAEIENLKRAHPDIVAHTEKYAKTPEEARQQYIALVTALGGKYASPEAAAVREAAESRLAVADQAFNKWVLDQEETKIPKRIMPLYVRMANPKVYDAEGKTPGDFPLTEKIQSAKKEGHDGVVFKNIADPSPVAVHYVVFSNADIKSAFSANFSESGGISAAPRIVGASTRPYTPAQLKMFQEVGRTVDEPSFVEKVKGLRKDLGKKLAQGLVDQFAPLKELSPQAYMLARLSKGAAGAFEAMLHHGKLRLNAGAYDADQTGGFVERVGKPLQGEMEDFLWWVAANRAERLSKEDREHLFTPASIAAGKTLADGQTTFDYVLQNGANKGQVTRDRNTIFKDALTTFDAFNKNALDMAEQSGLLDPESRKIWDTEFYVPFYRVSDEDGGFIGAKMKNGLVRQRAYKKLKGGEEKLNSDLLANTLANWAHLIDASAKNRAAKASLEAAANSGVAIEANARTVKAMGQAIGRKNATVWFMDGGVERHFLVDDPFVLTAITSLEYAGMRNMVMDAMTSFKHVLTVGVTASPAFKVRNLIRDSIQAIAVSPLGYNPIQNVREGIAASDPKSQTYVSALASGGLIRFGTMLEGRASDRVRQLVKAGVKDSTIINSDSKLRALYDKFIDPAVAAYNELGNRSEEINRAALYKQLTAGGMDHAQASLLARDLMDFSMQGSWTGIRFLTQVVPFMNARMQGLYKLGRASAEDKARFAAVLGATALFSLALLAAYGDDPDWKRREDWDRDNFWWFKIGGTAFRIPKPFEIGAIATLAERGVEYFVDPEMTGERLTTRVLKLLGDNLSMNPVPQAVKPILDVYANKDSFSGRPIETMGMEKLQPDYRFTSRTSMLARGVSTAGQAVAETVGGNFLSPVQIDHMLRGYFSWLGSFVVGATDVALRPLTDQPERPEIDAWKFATQGFVSELPADQSRYVSHMYEQAQQLEQAYGTYRQLVKEGKREEAQEFMAENRDKLAKYRSVESVKRMESRLNERIRMIERSALDPEEKRDRIRTITQMKERVAQAVY